MLKNNSLFIASVDSTFDKEFILQKIESFGLGRVRNIIVLPNVKNRNDTISNRVIIHFSYWFDNEYVNNVKNRIFNKQEIINTMYQEPCFWQIMAYRKLIKSF